MATIPFSIKIANYKCFGEDPQGIEVLKPINIIIGRNNSGKSALIDAIQQSCSPSPQFRPEDSPPGTIATLVYTATVSTEQAQMVFRHGERGGAIAGDHWETGKVYVGERLIIDQQNTKVPSDRTVRACSSDFTGIYTGPDAKQKKEKQLAELISKPWEGRLFRRLAAERNVTPEPESGGIEPQPGGQNVTNLIHNISNLARFDRRITDVLLLKALNEITEPDYAFSAILSRRIDDNRWEIFLQEETKGLVALSASGSGLKTILCVLANLILWPKVSGVTLKKLMLGFEELENSLHPALLRRLLLYISRLVRDEDGILFLTTHSNVVIDMFATDDEAQVIHTVHLAGKPATATVVSEYLHRRNILDDIDVRASDLLQSNGIIWLEGPSDRIYINHWISLLTKGELREGTHYQCVFYGGKLLAHLSADAPHDVDEMVSIFRVNINAAIIMDSDLEQVGNELGSTKRRMIEEISRVKGLAWVTSGREIENYLPVAAINAAADLQSGNSLGRFEDISSYLEAQKAGAGKKFERSKAEFAARAIGAVDLDIQSAVLDWKPRLTELCEHIRKWNKIEPEN
jgi:putative ATP-dependent endonuclease of the OLD family